MPVALSGRIVDAGIGDLEAPNERLSRRRIVVLARDANELGDVLCLDTRFLEIRCLLATRRTPGAPDVDHNDLAAIVLSRNGLVAAESRAGHSRQLFTLVRRDSR